MKASTDKGQPVRIGHRLTFLNALALLFIGLKLTGFIGWSWWWVTAPLWGPLALVLVVLACFAIAAGVAVALAFVAEVVADVCNRLVRGKAGP